MENNRATEDPLGFTDRTASLLQGLQIPKVLIDEIRKRNISTEELSVLNEDDLISLGNNLILYCSFVYIVESVLNMKNNKNVCKIK